MTEPTAEQVASEGEAARGLVKSILRDLEGRSGVGNELEAVDRDTRKELEETLGGIAATALARVRIEAQEAGLEKAEKLVRDAVVEESLASNGRVALALHRIAVAIRALRGRT